MEPRDCRQLHELASAALTSDPIYFPYQPGPARAVAIGKYGSSLFRLICDAASGFLQQPIFQEVTLSTLENATRLQDIHNTFQGKHLVVTRAVSLEDRILGFSYTNIILEVPTLKLLMESRDWIQLAEACDKRDIHFLVFGTVVKGKYVHHYDIPKLPIFTLVPQFLTDTLQPAELEVGVQLLKRKKKNDDSQPKK